MPEPIQAPQVTPLDRHNQRLVDNVHPAAWRNPEPARRYHLVVIGAGTAGLVAAAATAGLGGRVALIERHLLGGDCLNVGCVPSKAVLRAARAWKEASRLAEFGLEVEIRARDFGAVMARMRALRAEISANDSVARFRDLGVDVFLGHGRFTAPDAIEVEGATLRFHRALIATGARPFVPPIDGLAGAGFLTNETVFSLTALPARLAIVGGGPVGCELAQAFARFGSRVTLLLRGERLLPREDREAAELVREALEADGVQLLSSATARALRRSNRGKVLDLEVGGQPQELPIDELLIAAGRDANVEELGLEAAGVELAGGRVKVDDRLRTTNRSIFAAGDVASSIQFTHAADAMARIVVQNALFGGRARASALVVPWCTYTSPEVAGVGRTAAALTAARVSFRTVTVALEENDRARLDGAGRGLLQVHHARRGGAILGATLVSEHAGESIGELVFALRRRTKISELAATIHPYPTQAEAIRRAGDLARREALTPLVKRLFGAWFRFLDWRGERRRRSSPP